MRYYEKEEAAGRGGGRAQWQGETRKYLNDDASW